MISDKNRKAIDILIKVIKEMINNKCTTLPHDKTFASVIKGRSQKGNYKILKNGQEYEVSNATGMAFTVGQIVWIKIPCNNLNEMHICGIKK